MKKVLLSVTGIALIVLLLAALGGVVLASAEELVPSDVLEEQVNDDLNEIVSGQSAGVKEEASNVVNGVQDEMVEEAVELPVAEDLPSQEQVVEQDIPEDDDPEDDHPKGENVKGGCGGYADPSK